MNNEIKKPYEEVFERIAGRLKNEKKFKRDLYFIKIALKHLKELEDYTSQLNSKLLEINCDYGVDLAKGIFNYEENEEEN